jgi:hypothetical protein
MNANPAHMFFCGSIPLEHEVDVFNALAEIGGERLRRVPDGELGDRRMWVIGPPRAQLGRRIDYVHMPVPRERSDDDYFKPLAQLDPPHQRGGEVSAGVRHCRRMRLRTPAEPPRRGVPD